MSSATYDIKLVVTDYWTLYYVNRNLCSLCGNTGIIDTRSSAVSPAGHRAGRLNFCICPNGQGLRAGSGGIAPPLDHWEAK